MSNSSNFQPMSIEQDKQPKHLGLRVGLAVGGVAVAVGGVAFAESNQSAEPLPVIYNWHGEVEKKGDCTGKAIIKITNPVAEWNYGLAKATLNGGGEAILAVGGHENYSVAQGNTYTAGLIWDVDGNGVYGNEGDHSWSEKVKVNKEKPCETTTVPTVPTTPETSVETTIASTIPGTTIPGSTTIPTPETSVVITSPGSTTTLPPIVTTIEVPASTTPNRVTTTLPSPTATTVAPPITVGKTE